MGKTVFISYSHHQGGWVTDRLVPCLAAGGAEVAIDRERFEAGKGVVGQMDADPGLWVGNPSRVLSNANASRGAVDAECAPQS